MQLRLCFSYAYNSKNSRSSEPLRISNWRQLANVFLTANVSNVDIYRLTELVQQFNLAGDLI